MRKCISFVITGVVAAIVISSSATAYGMSEDIKNLDNISNDILPDTEKKEIAKGEVFLDKTVELTEVLIDSDSSNEPVDVSNVKKLVDFDGNGYTLLECNPTGYYIMHDETGQFIEYTPESKSPYLDANEELYYAGPMEYYVKSGSTFINTIDKSIINDTDDLIEIKKVSAEINDELLNYKNDDAIDYLYSENTTKKQSFNLKKNAVQATAKAVGHTYYWANKKSFFENRKRGFGYVGGGYCGYIASSLMLQYWNSCGKIKLNTFYTENNAARERLTRALIARGRYLGYGNATWGGTQANVINSFAKLNKIKANAGSAIGSHLAVKEVKSNKRPCILFGNLNNPQNGKKVKHAVVAYGVGIPKDSFNGFNVFVCHYGWEN